MMDAGEVATWGLAFRIGERVVLSAVVILVALVVTVGFWRTIQKVDFQFTKDKLSGAANVLLATPVFALLALIGFAWVSFSHPVSIGLPATDGGGKAAAGGQVAGGGGISYVGSVPGSPQQDANVDFERRRATGLVMSLNCLAKAAGSGVTPREEDALAEARLAALAPVWAEDWGDFAAFRNWALGRSTAAPDPEALAVFSAAHAEC